METTKGVPLFGLNKPSQYADQKEKLLEEMNTYGVDTPEYKTALKYLERLTKLEQSEKRRVDPNTWVMGGFGIGQILAVWGFENRHVLSQRVAGFMTKPKLGK